MLGSTFLTPVSLTSPQALDAKLTESSTTADAILAASSLSHLHLSGLLIGNGWIDPATQYLGYHEFAFQANLLTKDSAKGKELMRKVESCNATLEEGKKKGEEPGIHVGACEGILGFITDSTVQECVLVFLHITSANTG